MSDILIRGMKMPKDIEPGLVIEFADGATGERYARLFHYRYGALTEWLEAIELPEHGDLIDRDALEYDEAYLNGHYERGDIEIIEKSKVDEAPVVIPAGKENKNVN